MKLGPIAQRLRNKSILSHSVTLSAEEVTFLFCYSPLADELSLAARVQDIVDRVKMPELPPRDIGHGQEVVSKLGTITNKP